MWNKSVLSFVGAMVVICGWSGSATATVMVEYDAATSGGALPDAVGWTGYGTPMVHSGTYLTQDNTANDPGSDESGEYLSPLAGAGLMKLASGQYGIEFRVQPLSDVPFLGGGHYANLYVFWSDDTYAYNVTIDLDTDDAGPGTTGGIKYGQDSMSDAVTGIDWSTPHTVYIGYAGASPGGSFVFYVDGVWKSTVSVGSMARSGGWPFAQDRVDFGDGTTGQNLDVAAQWYFVRIHDAALPGNLPTNTPLIEYDAVAAGAGVDPTGVVPAWTKYGTAMTNNGAVLVQNNTADDPITQSGEYLSPAIPGLMRLASGQYGIEFRVRPLTDVPFLGSSHYANLYVFWSDDSWAYNVTIDLDTDDAGPGTTGGIKYGQNSMSDAVTGIDWSVPHTIFIGYTGASPLGSFYFYVDDVLKSTVSAGSMARSGGWPFAQDRVDFGDGTTGQPPPFSIDVAAEWTLIRIWARPYPIGRIIPPGLLVEFDAAAAGAGTTPEDVSPAWSRYGYPMTNNGTYLLQDNTEDDPLLEYGEYLSPPGPGGLMTLGAGKYGIEFRVRPLTDVPNLGYSHFANCYVTWSDDQYNYNLTVDKYTDDVSGTGGLKYGKDSMSDAVTGIDWSTPHTIYVGYRGDALPAGEFDFYVDKVKRATITAGNIARTGSYARNAVGFGDGTTGQPIPNEIDVAAEWYLMRIYGRAQPLCGDPAANVDGDIDVDLADFAAFQECYTGPGHTGPFVHDFCECFDFGNDGSIDQADTVVFDGCLSGPGVTANAACDG